MFKFSVSTLQKTKPVSTAKTNSVMLFRYEITLWRQNRKTCHCTVWTHNVEFLNITAGGKQRSYCALTDESVFFYRVYEFLQTANISILGLNLYRRSKRFSLLDTRPEGSWDLPSLLCHEYRGSFQGVKRPGLGIDHPLHLALKLRMSRSIRTSILPLCTCVAC
jgi:hypothetical protein